jgi:ParB-like chromosome segregation protein Spo0J
MLNLRTENAGATSGAVKMAKLVKVSAIKTDPTFSSIFKIDETILSEITESMKTKGYDMSQPVVSWKEKDVLLDGHTRLAAAKNAGITEIPVVYKSFKTEEDAKEYAFKRQAQRRNLTQAEIFAAASTIGLYKYGKNKELAASLNVSVTTVKRARTIATDADDDTIAAVKSGDMTINQAYEKTKTAKMLDTGKKPKMREPGESDGEPSEISIPAEEYSDNGQEKFDTGRPSPPEEYRSIESEQIKDSAEPVFRGSEIIMALIVGQYTAAAKMLAESKAWEDAYGKDGIKNYLNEDCREMLA